jgi:integrase
VQVAVTGTVTGNNSAQRGATLKRRITDSLAKNLEPPVKNPKNEKGGEKRRVYDTDQRGFGVYCTGSGKRCYFFQYRLGGKVRRATIGRIDDLKAKVARGIAADWSEMVARGHDPMEERDSAQEGLTVSEFWALYLEDTGKRWKEKTRGENVRRWEKDIEPALGMKRVADVTKKDILTLQKSVRDSSKKGKGEVSANFTLRIVRALFNAAVSWEIIERSPVQGVKLYPERKRERFLRADEFQRLFKAIEEEERIGCDPDRKPTGVKRKKDDPKEERGISAHCAALFRLLVYTGARLSEIQKAEWGFVHWEAGVLELPDSKTGAKRIPLNSPAMDELRKLWEIRSQKKWIIEGHVKGSHLVNPQKPWRRVRERASLEDVRLHDLRHSFASVGVSSGLALPIIGKALGHAQGRTTERYAHLSMSPVAAASELIGAQIVQAVNRPSAKVEEIGNEK